VLAALELTPTSVFFSSTRSRRVSAEPPQPAVALEARASSATDARASGASVDTSLQPSLSGLGVPYRRGARGAATRTAACSAPAYGRAPAGIGRRAVPPGHGGVSSAVLRPGATSWSGEVPNAARGAPRLALARGAIRRSFVSIRRVVEVRLDRRGRAAETIADLGDRSALELAVVPGEGHCSPALCHSVRDRLGAVRRHRRQRIPASWRLRRGSQPVGGHSRSMPTNTSTWRRGGTHLPRTREEAASTRQILVAGTKQVAPAARHRSDGSARVAASASFSRLPVNASRARRGGALRPRAPTIWCGARSSRASLGWRR
jgi:hypothetical protein